MITIFRNSENSKAYDAHSLNHSLMNKMNLQRGDKHVALSDLSIYYSWKNIKRLYETIGCS